MLVDVLRQPHLLVLLGTGASFEEFLLVVPAVDLLAETHQGDLLLLGGVQEHVQVVGSGIGEQECEGQGLLG